MHATARFQQLDVLRVRTDLNALIGLWRTIDRDHLVIVSEFSPGMLPGISHRTGPEYLRFPIAQGYRIGEIKKTGPRTVSGTLSRV
jgi:hypothetical protein